MRRLRTRPSSVALDGERVGLAATVGGEAVEAMPHSRSHATTASARAIDRRRLTISLPWLSVWPTTRTATPASAASAGASASSARPASDGSAGLPLASRRRPDLRAEARVAGLPISTPWQRGRWWPLRAAREVRPGQFGGTVDLEGRWIASVAVSCRQGWRGGEQAGECRRAGARSRLGNGSAAGIAQSQCTWRLHAARGQFVERGSGAGMRARNPAQNADESSAALRYDSAAPPGGGFTRFSRKRDES